MKHKVKRLEYAHQYQTMSTKECRKIVFLDEKKFDLDDLSEVLASKIFSRRDILNKE